ncbi:MULTISPECIES: nitrilase-related carbon-nitrogen hydrolase [Candidatus Nitrosocaldus]|jgi:predicted amidohydrolase|uniref:Putative Amidohydrolase n=1 Tax=Candidatus Nitrosocaldus cavascurensis TaxID=2058097 RepID=A0A2K5AT69_9ARCH|nr:MULTISPECIES: nitrilase-related carbon-nitrogen hydrolase [Candidatus Nitrosocaldus]SPC34831.1 putative Amidohydrolase [Candidatus Nitrosocaldus cavascurensis]
MRRLRIASTQFILKPYSSLSSFMDDVSKMLDMSKGCDIVVFGEWFTLGLLSIDMDIDKATYDDIPRLARFTDDLCSRFSDLAIGRGQCIVAGTTVEEHSGRYYDTCFIFMPDGSMYRHRKTHLFPLEKDAWHMSEHDTMEVFEYSSRGCNNSDSSSIEQDGFSVKFGVCICYESQIPECSRVLALNGAELIVCPSLTLTDAGYNRIRHSCEARCIENQLLVVLSSTVGNLAPFPVRGIGRSAILAPCDKPWPSNGIIADGIMNVEHIVMAEVDLDGIKMTREHGAARTHRDRMEKIQLYSRWFASYLGK